MKDYFLNGNLEEEMAKKLKSNIKITFNSSEEKQRPLRVVTSMVSSIPNIVLTKEERREVDRDSAKIKSVKVKKASYFGGFKTVEE